MILHYLTIAFRNLLKYRTQNIISIIGLAVGFACFAFSALWIRYEMNYDNFHSKADRIYRVHMNIHKWEMNSDLEILDGSPNRLASFLKTQFPEIEDACNVLPFTLDKNIECLYADFSFCNIFDVPIPENFFIEGRTDRPVAVTDELKGYTEYIKENHNYDVQTSISRWPTNTNIPFSMVIPANLMEIPANYPKELWPNNWFYYGYDTYILVGKGVDIKALAEKLDKVYLPEKQYPFSIIMTPIKQVRYNNPSGNSASDIKFSHIRIFALAGLLVILCSLFNHLTLFVSRVRMRLRELALRKVNGATDGQVAATLYTDFLLVILLSLIAGFMLMGWLLPAFKEYATIGDNNTGIYSELLIYAVLLIVCSLIACVFPVIYFRKQALNDCIMGSGAPGSRNLFRKVSLLVQLTISVGLMFCSVVFIKQMRFLQHADFGIDRRNVAAVETSCCPLTAHYADRIRQIPGVKDALRISGNYFLSGMRSGGSPSTYVKDGKEITYSIFHIFTDAHFFDFFGVEIIEGTGHSNDYTQAVYSETVMKEVGESLRSEERVIGVCRDFYLTPTTKAVPTMISFPLTSSTVPDAFKEFLPSDPFRAIAYRYEEGMRLQTEQAVTQWLREEFADQGVFEINFAYMEDIFDEYFKSERALFTLLSVMTLACILIAVFGVYSLTSLTCRQRRKEIAIRKINGAETVDITNIFFKEYLLLLFVGVIVAFPIGYAIMKRWIEGYVKQTSMDAWLYVLIFLIVFIVIAFSIASMVWKAAKQNPAEAIKN